MRGYVVKAAAGIELIQAIHAVSAGSQFLSPSLTPMFIEGPLDVSIGTSPYERLSNREREVLRCIVSASS